MQVNKPYDPYNHLDALATPRQLAGYAIVSVLFLGFTICATFTGDFSIRQKAREEMRKALEYAQLVWAWIPETIYRIAAVYWRTNGLEYHGRHRLEGRGALQH